MTYDHWKTTNPEDQFLGPEPERCPVCGDYLEEIFGSVAGCGYGVYLCCRSCGKITQETEEDEDDEGCSD